MVCYEFWASNEDVLAIMEDSNKDYSIVIKWKIPLHWTLFVQSIAMLFRYVDFRKDGESISLLDELQKRKDWNGFQITIQSSAEAQLVGYDEDWDGFNLMTFRVIPFSTGIRFVGESHHDYYKKLREFSREMGIPHFSTQA